MVVDPHFSLLGVWIGGSWVESRGEYAGAGALARFRELDCADCAGKRKSICLFGFIGVRPSFQWTHAFPDTTPACVTAFLSAMRSVLNRRKRDKRSHGSRYNLLPLVQPPMSYWCVTPYSPILHRGRRGSWPDRAPVDTSGGRPATRRRPRPPEVTAVGSNCTADADAVESPLAPLPYRPVLLRERRGFLREPHLDVRALLPRLFPPAPGRPAPE